MIFVGVLMCTFRGQRYIRRQLATIRAQTFDNWRIFVSDDGSDDETLELILSFREKVGNDRITVFHGPRKGFVANFLSLIHRPEVDCDYCAFADQDDEWDVEKLERAVAALEALPPGTPGIYGSRSELINGSGESIGASRLFMKPPGFANALVQNIVSGNTMVLNGAAVRLIRAAGEHVGASHHDWWAYLLVTGAGGQMIYDPRPSIRYRQHDANLMGENISLPAMAVRVAKLFAGDFRKWNSMNATALRRCQNLLNEESIRLLDLFEGAREGSIVSRLLNLRRAQVYRQTWDGQLGLLAAAMMNRL